MALRVAFVLGLASPLWAGDPSLSLVVGDDSTCVRRQAVPPDEVIVEVRMDTGGAAAIAYQTFVTFETERLAFVDGRYTSTPFGLPVEAAIAESPAGRLTLAAGINPIGGQTPASGEAVLAVLRFVPLAADCATALDFDTSGQANMIVAPGGTPLPGLHLVGSDPVAIDDTPPFIDACCPPVSLVANGSCFAAIPDLTGCVTAADVCSDDVAIAQTPVAGTPVGLGTTTVTILVADCAGNTAFCQTAVTVTDAAPPTIAACPSGRTLKADNDCGTRVPDLRGEVVAADGCDSILTITQTPPPDTVIPLGVTAVTITVADDFGNASSCAVELSVIDSSPPFIGWCAPPATIGADATCTAVIPDLTRDIVAVDNCTPAMLLDVAQTPPAGTMVSAPAVVDVTITVTDASGASDQCTTQVTVVDVTAPSIDDCPAALELSLDAACRAKVPDLTAALATADECGGPVVVTQNPPPGTIILGVRTTPVTLHVTDASGNVASCVVSVTTRDDTPPDIVQCSGQITIPADADCGALVPLLIGGVVAVESCPGLLTKTQDPPAGTVIGTGVTEVTVTVTDASGNASQCVTGIVVVDSTPPAITCPGSAAAECAGPDGAAVTFAVTAIDDCDADPAVTCHLLDETMEVVDEVASGDHFPTGRSFVLCEAVDRSGNTAQCLFPVTVGDTTAPTIVACGEPRVLGLDPACRAAVPDLRGEVSAVDACDGDLAITQSPAPGTLLLGPGTQLVTLTVSDDAGNHAACKVPVTAIDDTPPMFLACGTAVALDAGANCLAQIPSFMPGVMAVDNCPGAVTVSQSPAPGTLVAPGVTVVTITAIDAGGNAAQCTAPVTVIDGTDPVIHACAADLELPADPACTAVMPDLTLTVVASDGCSDAWALEVTQHPTPGATLPVGVTMVTLTVTDENGNSDACTSMVLVSDTERPTLACPADVTVEAEPDVCHGRVDLDHVEARDACDGAITARGMRSDGQSLQAPFPLGATIVTWTAADAAGNSASCQQSITVIDSVAPLLTCPPSVTVAADAGACAAEVGLGSAAARDSCDTNVALEAVRGDGLDLDDPYPVGTTTVTWTATDDDGNVTACTRTVTVGDAAILRVDIDLLGGVHAGPLERCLAFELTACDPPRVDIVLADLVFLQGTAEFVDIEVPCGVSYDLVTVRDPLHTLRSSAPLSTVDGRYRADLTGPRALVSGDLNDDDVVDIVDFAIFAGRFLTMPGADTPCGGPFDPAGSPHADIDGDGFVFLGDFTHVAANFRATSGAAGCGGGVAASAAAPRPSLPVAALAALGVDRPEAADLDGDGLVDESDLATFANATPPRAPRQLAGRTGGSWHDRRSWSGGLRPRQRDDVVVTAPVTVERRSAAAAHVRIGRGGVLDLASAPALLTVDRLEVEAGGVLSVAEGAAVEPLEIVIAPGGVLRLETAPLVAETATLAGTLDLRGLDVTGLRPGDALDLILAGRVTGGFDRVRLPEGGPAAEITCDPDGVRLRAAACAVRSSPGDPCRPR